MSSANNPEIEQKLKKCKHELELARITLFTKRREYNDFHDAVESHVGALASTVNDARTTWVIRLVDSTSRHLVFLRQNAAALIQPFEQRVAEHVKELERLKSEKEMFGVTREGAEAAG